MKLSVELVGGVVVGGLIGWALDQLFGTKPILMLVFLVLGAASGIMNVMRTAKAMQEEPMPGHHLRVQDGRDVAAENDKDKDKGTLTLIGAAYAAESAGHGMVMAAACPIPCTSSRSSA